MDIDDKKNEKSYQYFGLELEDLPTMRMMDMKEMTMDKYQPDTTELDAASIKTFVLGVKRGLIKVGNLICISVYLMVHFADFVKYRDLG